MADPKTGVAALPRLTLVARCAELLAELRAGTSGVVSATVSTTDGLAVASTLADRHEVDKLSAMSSSIAALASALTREAARGEPERVILESARGHIVSMKVPAAHAGLVLTVVGDDNAVLGKLLWSCRAISERIAASACAPAD
jgi:predicted regulator of Ras-like GTPase activity (Roadblock/LC7/MglB family)